MENQKQQFAQQEAQIMQNQHDLQKMVVTKQIDHSFFMEREAIKHANALAKMEKQTQIREIAEIRRDLQTLEIRQNSCGRLEARLARGENETGRSRIVIAEEFAGARCYFTTFPVPEAVLVVNFRLRDTAKKICFPLDAAESGIKSDARKFALKLQSAGVRIHASTRLRAEIVDALFTFILREAEMVEVPTKYGYTRSQDNAWVLAKPGDITMEVVKKW